MGDHDKNKSAHNKAKVNFPAEFDPGTVIHSAHGQLDERASGPKAVGDPVAVLIGQYQHLLIDPQYFSQRLKDRHDDNRLAAAGDNEKVKQRNKNEDDQQSQ